jgi:putative membrane protein
MLLIHPLHEIPRALPVLLGVVVAGANSGRGALWGAAALVITMVLAISRWFTTSYRITDDRVEVRSGLFRRRVLAVSRDRVRTVDVTARALHRLLGLTRVDVGTGRSEDSGAVRLDGLTEAEARALRGELLHRREAARAQAAAPAAAPAAGATVPTGAPAPPAPALPETELARLDPRWVWYAPFTLSGLVSLGVVAGFLLNLVNEANVDPESFGPLRRLVHELEHAPTVVAIAELAALAAVAVIVASTVGYVMAFWDFRLTRQAEGTLHVTRGLLTTRATTIEERRLHGVEIGETLLLRLVGAARCIAIATGLRVRRGPERSGALLLPPAPRSAAERVGAEVIASAEPLTCPLVEHGPRARRRRFTRALAGWALLAAALAVAWAAGLPPWPLAASLLLLPAAAALAADRYRNLGHAVADGRLVARSGSLVRRRTALAAEGIIGFNLERSFFQRRAGLATLTATTAAGHQRYEVLDVETGEALRLAQELVPGLAEPFLERAASSAAGASPASSVQSRVR